VDGLLQLSRPTKGDVFGGSRRWAIGIGTPLAAALGPSACAERIGRSFALYAKTNFLSSDPDADIYLFDLLTNI
jgi:hypothetical protein